MKDATRTILRAALQAAPALDGPEAHDLRDAIRRAETAIARLVERGDADAKLRARVLDSMYDVQVALFEGARGTDDERVRTAFRDATTAYHAIVAIQGVKPWTVEARTVEAARFAAVEASLGRLLFNHVVFDLPPGAFVPDETGVSAHQVLVWRALLLTVPPSRVRTARVLLAYLDAGFADAEADTPEGWRRALHEHTVQTVQLHLIAEEP